MDPDTSSTLETIRNQTPAPIAATLIDIQKNEEFDRRSRDWIRSLEYLDLSQEHKNDEKKLLKRDRINGLYHRNYVAVSYTWDHPEYFNSSNGKYLVAREAHEPTPSKVRDGVLDRVINYVGHCRRGGQIKGFWIDQECINQDNSAEKELAIQSMEYVYSQSDFPVGLLSKRIESADDLEALIDLLQGKGSDNSRVFQLLKYLISDSWWGRAWTFQEDYRGSTRMVLLIGHDPSLEHRKKEVFSLLGDLSGDICIKSTEFRKKATELCMAYQSNTEYADDIHFILDRAAKYDILLQEIDQDGGSIIRRAMSPIIFSDVGKRDITLESDRLAVIANCCGYSVRLDTRKLNSKKCRMSLSMLCLFLLNGEILMNNEDNDTNPLKKTIFEFLSQRSPRTFQPPDVDGKLTFIKGCRFPNVRFSNEGIHTSGHLWMLGKIVEDPISPVDSANGADYWLNACQRTMLDKLARRLESELSEERYGGVAFHLDRFLYQDKHWRGTHLTFSKQYKDLMAEEVVEAMRTGKTLRLARLVTGDAETVHTPYTGVFVGEDNFQWDHQAPSYVFTAFCPAHENPDGIDKHVSLEVEWRELASADTPRLFVKRWINGLYFFDGCPRRDVVFPWPASFLA